MRTLPADSPDALPAATAVLAAGGVVVHPTETCYGLAADLTNPEAVARLFTLKSRPDTQPVSGLFPTIEDAQQWVAWNEVAQLLAAAYMPGPLTIILPLQIGAPAKLWPAPAGGTTLGVRVSSHPLAAALAKAYGKPISTSSANRHGEPNPYDPAILHATWPSDGPDLLLDAGVLPERPPSTVVDLTAGGQVRRQGAAGK